MTAPAAKPGTAGTGAGPAPDTLARTVWLTLIAGWTMAVLYGSLPGDGQEPPSPPEPGAAEGSQAESAVSAADGHNDAAEPDAAEPDASEADDAEPDDAGDMAEPVASPRNTGMPPIAAPVHLATLHELPASQRRIVELARLRYVLGELAALPGAADAGLPVSVPDSPVPLDQLRLALMRLNFSILAALTGIGPEAELAYELGRSLRDTASPPVVAVSASGGRGGRRANAASAGKNSAGKHSDRRASLLAQLDRGRVTRIQEWLGVLAWHLPKHAAAVVSASLGRWSEFAAVTVGPSAKRKTSRIGPDAFAEKMSGPLLVQGDVWLMLLCGTQSTASLLGPEGYVAAGEAALGRAGRIAKGVLKHYWPALLVLLAALAGMLYLAFEFTEGAATAWTSIASITGTVGVSAAGTSSVLTRLGEEAALPVFAPAEEDAMAWAITTLPQADLRRSGVRRLRKAGVPPSSGLGHV